MRGFGSQRNKPKLMLGAVAVLAGLFLLGGCASTTMRQTPFETLTDNKKNRVVVSLYAPHPEYVCKLLGFLPCSLNSQEAAPVINDPYVCAKNVLAYAEKVDTNFIHLESPVQALGITWRDSKANLYHCAYVPQPLNKPTPILPPPSAPNHAAPTPQKNSEEPNPLRPRFKR